MLIRFVLRAIPLICVAIFALAVHVTHTPAERAREMAHLANRPLTWAAGQVRCADPWGNLPGSACPGGIEAQKTDVPSLSGRNSVLN